MSWLRRNPRRKIEQRYRAKKAQALEARRKGRIRRFVVLAGEAQALRMRLLELEEGKRKQKNDRDQDKAGDFGGPDRDQPGD